MGFQAFGLKPHIFSFTNNKYNYQFTKGGFMAATTTEGKGSGAVEKNFAKIYNGVVKSNNIPAGVLISSDLADGAVTSAKINDSAVTLGKIATGAVSLPKMNWIAGGLKFAGEVVAVNFIKAKATFSSGPDSTTLEIANNQPDNNLNIKVAYKVVAASFDSGVISINPAVYNTFHQVATVNSEGEMVEAIVMDQSFHNSYRITMQVRQADTGSVHLVVEHIMDDSGI